MLVKGSVALGNRGDAFSIFAFLRCISGGGAVRQREVVPVGGALCGRPSRPYLSRTRTVRRPASNSLQARA
jgi:hypothetical protein